MIELSKPQHIFLNELNTKFRAYVGGFGSGKTFVGCLDQILWFSNHPKTIQGYFGPSYPSIRDVFYPTFDEAAHMLGFRVEIREANKEVHIYRNGRYYGTTICRSMDRPESIVGFKISRALVDELDTLPRDKAKRAWNKIIARMRLTIDGEVNSVGVTTTPEGFKFVYDRFANKPKESYSMVQASTWENLGNLPEDYIASLEETYPEELRQAYLLGEFVNLTSGTVYNAYNRVTHDSNETVQEKDPLRIGMDFNVGNMSAVVYVMRGEAWHAVDELKGIFDTPAMIDTIQSKYPEHNIRIYPDSTGDKRKSVNASTSDIALLQQAGFSVYYNRSQKTGGGFNLPVKDRVISANMAFTNGKLYVNSARCHELARCFEQLAYDDNGEPDKKSNLDHLPDAATYPIVFEMPIKKPATKLDVRFAR